MAEKSKTEKPLLVRTARAVGAALGRVARTISPGKESDASEGATEAAPPQATAAAAPAPSGPAEVAAARAPATAVGKPRRPRPASATRRAVKPRPAKAARAKPARRK